MKYRVGDKVYCIKDKKSPDGKDTVGMILYSKGNFYTIKNYRDGNYLDLSSNIDNFSFAFFLYEAVPNIWLFNEYFITLKDLRKQKLQRLYETNLY